MEGGCLVPGELFLERVLFVEGFENALLRLIGGGDLTSEHRDRRIEIRVGPE